MPASFAAWELQRLGCCRGYGSTGATEKKLPGQWYRALVARGDCAHTESTELGPGYAMPFGERARRGLCEDRLPQPARRGERRTREHWPARVAPRSAPPASLAATSGPLGH